MRPLVACDLDRTLIYSPKAFWLETPDDLAPPIVVTELWNGVPISFMTRESERLLAALRQEAEFVPVTTRTIAQYRRVQLGAAPRFAVTSNGGEILVDGERDADWGDGVRARLAAETAPLAEVHALFGDLAAAAWILKTNIADDLFVYSIVDRDLMPAEWLEELRLTCEAFGWAVSVQGRKLYCVPKVLTKREAVSEVARRLGGPRVLAAGDSLLDQPMLEGADAAFRPAHGELHDAEYRAGNLEVTSLRGILAGEELLHLLRAAATT
ncbi:HAD family hydrolase [Herbiconiux sp. CPCC 203407]|uniref:HAD family hydrolase n=1 Tax=Herbiconiux oxytropis TaxID=2970915 RepID=A0AA41XIK2_9MICO|nr:HAD family hydrolase [Herbiconiux oxytropis]MCS5722208.1 HAD family hydrolase [Herbiconiux oxytropis]MCS5727154.1 HAD family hydrolase [Herbiconiux oxytropis]